jgi:hypothetical protein
MPAGPSMEWHLRRSVKLESTLEKGAPEDFTVGNDERSVREVAMEILHRAGWLSATHTA